LEVVTQAEYLKREKERASDVTVLDGMFRHRTMTLVSTITLEDLDLFLLQKPKVTFTPLIDPLQDHKFLGGQAIQANLEPQNQVQKLAVLPQLIGKLSGLRVCIAELMRGPTNTSVFSRCLLASKKFRTN
jgi:hypothetical protein